MTKKKTNTKKAKMTKEEIEFFAKKPEAKQGVQEPTEPTAKPVTKTKVAKGPKKVWNARARNYFWTNKL